ncbi:MAG: hypothetical protein K1X66_06660 [Verrucomicrobiae bacterium]|nr:hypothetical protein [Verrucomicrobiae bacterium]
MNKFFIILILSLLFSGCSKGPFQTISTPKIDKLTELIKHHPNEAWHYKERAYCYAILGLKQQAIKDVNIALKLAPENAPLHSQMGWALFNAGAFKLALKTWEKAAELSDFQNLYDYYALAIGHWANGDDLEAMKFYDETAKKDSDFGEWLTLEEKTKHWTRKEKEAIYRIYEMWRKSYRLKPYLQKLS